MSSKHHSTDLLNLKEAIMEYLRENLVGDVLVVGFRVATISDPLSVSAVLKELVSKQKSSGLSRVVIDFTGIQLFSTGMLGALLTFRSRGLVKGFSLKLTGLSAGLEQVFAMRSLDGLFEACTSLHDAVGCFSSNLEQPKFLSA